MEKLLKRNFFKYKITENSIDQDCKYVIFYDNKDIDLLHVKSISVLIPRKNLKSIELPYSGHPALHYLKELNLSKRIIEFAICNKSLDGIDFLGNRKKSRTYFRTILKTLIEKKHYMLAKLVVQAGKKIHGNYSWFSFYMCCALNNKGEEDAAISSINEAISLEPENPHFYAYKSGLLAQMGVLEDAVANIEIAIKIDDRNPSFHFHKSGLMDRLGKIEGAISSINEAISLEPEKSAYYNYLKYLTTLKLL